MEKTRIYCTDAVVSLPVGASRRTTERSASAERIPAALSRRRASRKFPGSFGFSLPSHCHPVPGCVFALLSLPTSPPEGFLPKAAKLINENSAVSGVFSCISVFWVGGTALDYGSALEGLRGKPRGGVEAG